MIRIMDWLRALITKTPTRTAEGSKTTNDSTVLPDLTHVEKWLRQVLNQRELNSLFGYRHIVSEKDFVTAYNVHRATQIRLVDLLEDKVDTHVIYAVLACGKHVKLGTVIRGIDITQHLDTWSLPISESLLRAIKENSDFQLVSKYWLLPKDVLTDKVGISTFEFLFGKQYPTLTYNATQREDKLQIYQSLKAAINLMESKTPLECRDYAWFSQRSQLVIDALYSYLGQYVYISPYVNSLHSTGWVKILHVTPSMVPTLFNTDDFSVFVQSTKSTTLGYTVRVFTLLKEGYTVEEAKEITADISNVQASVEAWCKENEYSDLYDVVKDGLKPNALYAGVGCELYLIDQGVHLGILTVPE